MTGFSFLGWTVPLRTVFRSTIEISVNYHGHVQLSLAIIYMTLFREVFAVCSLCWRMMMTERHHARGRDATWTTRRASYELVVATRVSTGRREEETWWGFYFMMHSWHFSESAGLTFEQMFWDLIYYIICLSIWIFILNLFGKTSTG